MPCYMLDTNVFNHVLDGKIALTTLVGKNLVVTHVQRDELARTPDEARRNALLKIFAELISDQAAASGRVADISATGVVPESSGGVVPTESLVWNVSRWGQANWGTNDDMFANMKADLDALNKCKRNNDHDILIAETAVRNKFILITSDVDLLTIVRNYGGLCENASSLIATQPSPQAAMGLIYCAACERSRCFPHTAQYATRLTPYQLRLTA